MTVCSKSEFDAEVARPFPFLCYCFQELRGSLQSPVYLEAMSVEQPGQVQSTRRFNSSMVLSRVPGV